MSQPMPQTQRFPFFPDNEEYWFEAKRAFGASSYAASEFGECLAKFVEEVSEDSCNRLWRAQAGRRPSKRM